MDMQTLTHQTRCMLVGLEEPFASQEEILANFEELAALVTAFGGKVFAAAFQNKTRGDGETYIGQGKAQELVSSVVAEKIDVVVVNAAVKPRQLYALQNIFIAGNPKILVWDRVDLILAIFQKHAATAEAKLQIKLASMRHMGPRIYGMGAVLSQQGGGIGTRGIGETNVELMQRHWRNEVAQVRKQLEKITKSKTSQMEQRKRNSIPTVSIVGYTNAGKTTLFNLLCGKKNTVNNALFVTLDSSVGSLYLPNFKKEVFVTDTIGFIRNLPTDLVDSFKSTLMETIHADCIIHVIDASDARVTEKITVVEEILRDLGAGGKPIIYVFNKADLVDVLHLDALKTRYSAYHPLVVSAKTGQGKDALIDAIELL